MFAIHTPILRISGCILLMFAALHSSVSARAQNAPLPAEIENEQVLGLNKQPYHATLMPYPTRTEAVAAIRAKSSWAQSLNGEWKFRWVPRPELRPVDFYKPDYDVSSWKEIPVPSNWEIQGYGTPFYRNFGYTFKKDWPQVMTEPPRNYTAYVERDPVGSYRRDFEVPEGWAGRRIFLTFAGVDSAFYVWINGRMVGYSVNSRNPAEFDVTDFVLAKGKNTLAVEVYKYSAGSYLEDQDMWRLSGIFRDVTLWSAPPMHIRDFSVVPELDGTYTDAQVHVTAKIRNFSKQAESASRLAVELVDGKGRSVPGGTGAVAVPALGPDQETTVTTTLTVARPDKWTAETPVLYTTVLKLGEQANRTEYVSTRTGFRKIEIKDAVFMINGVPVKLKGADRHENWPDTGHYVSEDRMRRDLELLKQVNANHVRTSHYTDDPRWYELADEYGIYLVAEANVECHGYYGVLDREPRYEKAIVDRNIANVENLKNHASVLIWSLGNECGGGSSFLSALKQVKSMDPTRLTHYEAFEGGEKQPADIESHMYTDVASLEKAAKDPGRKKPLYLCEYAHAMNNSMGSVGEYNDLFDKYPKLMGGAIWEWEDQGIWNRRDPKRVFLAFGGGFGEFPNDHYFIHKGVVFSDRTPKPHYAELKRVYQWASFAPQDLSRGSIEIKNRYAFTNLNKFEASWMVSEDGVAVARGELGRLEVQPGASTVVHVPVSRIKPRPGKEYFLQVSLVLARNEIWAKAGYEVATAQFELPIHASAVKSAATDLPALQLQRGERITVQGRGFSVVFDKASGKIAEISRDGKQLLVAQGGPSLYLWRAPHRNDDMWAAKSWEKYGVRDLHADSTKVDAEQVSASEVRVRSSIVLRGLSGWSAVHDAVYTITGDGRIAVENTFTPQGERIPLARIGVRLELERELNQFTYLGRGPMENYSDRMRGSDVGRYSSSVQQQLTPYAKPMEAGNHQDVRWAALTGEGMPGLLAQSEGAHLQVSALPYSDEELDSHEYSVDLPASDKTVLTLSTKTLGVGSASCGPRPLNPYIVWSDPTQFSYVLQILPAGEKNFDRFREPSGRNEDPINTM
jgi:beta-galactosidase